MSSRHVLFQLKSTVAEKNGISVSTSNTLTITVLIDNRIFTSFSAAYFTRASFYQLSTVDDIPGIRKLPILEGVFECTRFAKHQSRKNRPDENKSSGICKPVISARPYSPLPSQNPEGLSSPRDACGNNYNQMSFSGPQLLLSDSY